MAEASPRCMNATTLGCLGTIAFLYLAVTLNVVRSKWLQRAARAQKHSGAVTPPPPAACARRLHDFSAAEVAPTSALFPRLVPPADRAPPGLLGAWRQPPAHLHCSHRPGNRHLPAVRVLRSRWVVGKQEVRLSIGSTAHRAQRKGGVYQGDQVPTSQPSPARLPLVPAAGTVPPDWQPDPEQQAVAAVLQVKRSGGGSRWVGAAAAAAGGHDHVPVLPQGWALSRPLSPWRPPHLARRFCKKCQAYKPPRTHHCRRCGRCILRMDHHW